VSSCCHFCPTEVVTQTRYVIPDFAECSLFYPEEVEYSPLPKNSLSRFTGEDLLVLLNNLALREKELNSLKAVISCYSRVLKEASTVFKGDKDE